MKTTLAYLAALAAGIAVVSPAAAGPLTFKKLEFQQPRDPLLSNFNVYTEVHHSPADQLGPALAILRRAIPVGTSLAAAEATLTQAGARCGQPIGGQTACKYHGLQTVDEYLDEATWTVTLVSAADAVMNLEIKRDWQRHM